MTLVSVIVPTWNTRELLRAALESLKGSLPMSSEVLVIDNGSRDGTARMVHEQFPWVRLVKNVKNTGFAHAINQGIEMARGAYVLLLNSDAQVRGDAVRRMTTFLEENPRYAAVVPRLLNSDGSTQKAHLRFPTLLTPLLIGTPLERWMPENFEVRRYFARGYDYDVDGDVRHPAAACFLMRRKALKVLRPMDESMWLFFSDADLCQRLWDRNWRIRYLAGVEVVHLGGMSTRQYGECIPEWHRNRLAYYRKHYGRLAGAWVKACVAWTLVDHCVRELWRRAHGAVEEPLLPLFEDFALFLRR